LEELNQPAGRPVVRVWVVEDQPEIRNSLAALIGGTPCFECAGSFGSMEAAIRAMTGQPPDVALCDIGLPGMSGIEGIRRIHEKWPQTSPVMLTVYDDDDRILEALCAGANGYLLKNTPPARLLEAILDSASGGSPMSPEVARRVVELFRRVQPPPRADYQLTPHELRILNLLVRGENYKTAAAQLGVSVNTISYHIRHIYEKLHVHSRTGAVAKALQSGLFR
jgi:DNA-binding NarL/FixJ family response regulator